jgi:hypothetical protein
MKPRNSTPASCLASVGGCFLAFIPVTVIGLLLLVPLLFHSGQEEAANKDFNSGWSLLGLIFIGGFLAVITGLLAGGVAAIFTFRHARRTSRFPLYAVAGYVLALTAVGALMAVGKENDRRARAARTRDEAMWAKWKQESELKTARENERALAERTRANEVARQARTDRARILLGVLWYQSGRLADWYESDLKIEGERIQEKTTADPAEVLRFYARRFPEHMVNNPASKSHGLPGHVIFYGSRPCDQRQIRIEVLPLYMSETETLISFECTTVGLNVSTVPYGPEQLEADLSHSQ